jgi:hypothetical protein
LERAENVSREPRSGQLTTVTYREPRAEKFAKEGTAPVRLLIDRSLLVSLNVGVGILTAR